MWEQIYIFSNYLQILADEQKKLHPDCWKRKRSMSSAASQQNTASSSGGTSLHPIPVSLTHTRLSHPGLSSFLNPNISLASGLSLISVPPLEHNNPR